MVDAAEVAVESRSAATHCGEQCASGARLMSGSRGSGRKNGIVTRCVHFLVGSSSTQAVRADSTARRACVTGSCGVRVHDDDHGVSWRPSSALTSSSAGPCLRAMADAGLGANAFRRRSVTDRRHTMRGHSTRSPSAAVVDGFRSTWMVSRVQLHPGTGACRPAVYGPRRAVTPLRPSVPQASSAPARS